MPQQEPIRDLAGPEPQRPIINTVPFEQWTIDGLRDRAARYGIDGRYEMDRDELTAALRQHTRPYPLNDSTGHK